MISRIQFNGKEQKGRREMKREKWNAMERRGEWKTSEGNRHKRGREEWGGGSEVEMRWQRRGAVLITPLCESLCGFNGVSVTAGANPVVLSLDTIHATHTHTHNLYCSTTVAVGLKWHQQSFWTTPSSLLVASEAEQVRTWRMSCWENQSREFARALTCDEPWMTNKQSLCKLPDWSFVNGNNHWCVVSVVCITEILMKTSISKYKSL